MDSLSFPALARPFGHGFHPCIAKVSFVGQRTHATRTCLSRSWEAYAREEGIRFVDFNTPDCREKLKMAMRSQGNDPDRRLLLFGGRGDPHGAHRRPNATTLSSTQVAPGNGAANEREMLEAANDNNVDGLRGQVGEMRHVSHNANLLPRNYVTRN